MRVSVIIPAYNEQEVIGATIEALLAQSHPDVEIIVVDNNSKDHTPGVVQRYTQSHPQVRYFFESLPGVQRARERGRIEATGEVIANLDADCHPPRTWVEHALAYFRDPHIVSVAGPYDFTDGSAWLRGSQWFGQHIFLNLVNRVAYRLFRHGVAAMGGNMFIRAWAMAAIGGYDTTIVFYGDDVNTFNRLARVGRVIFRNDVAVRSSARRFVRHGAWHTQWVYFLNYLWMVFAGRPYRNARGD